MVIWKFVLKSIEMQELTMPEGAEILSVANQSGNLCLWAMVDPERPNCSRYVEIIGTGNPIQANDRKFIGTAVIAPFVRHVFERTQLYR